VIGEQVTEEEPLTDPIGSTSSRLHRIIGVLNAPNDLSRSGGRSATRATAARRTDSDPPDDPRQLFTNFPARQNYWRDLTYCRVSICGVCRGAVKKKPWPSDQEFYDIAH